MSIPHSVNLKTFPLPKQSHNLVPQENPHVMNKVSKHGSGKRRNQMEMFFQNIKDGLNL